MREIKAYPKEKTRIPRNLGYGSSVTLPRAGDRHVNYGFLVDVVVNSNLKTHSLFNKYMFSFNGSNIHWKNTC